MDMQRMRMFLLITLVFLGINIFMAWDKDYGQKETSVASVQSSDTAEQGIPGSSSTSGVPGAVGEKIANALTSAENVLGGAAQTAPANRFITVKTDVLDLKIDLQGGDIVQASLPKYAQNFGSSDGFMLLDKSDKRFYYTQSGLSSEVGPDSPSKGRGFYTTDKTHYELGANDTKLEVRLHWQDPQGVKVEKKFVFEKGKYLVDVGYDIQNDSSVPYSASLYAQATRRLVEEQSSSMFGMQMYQGGAMFTPDTPYTKVPFGDMEEKALSETIKGGWSAMSERYFVTAWIPSKDLDNHYFTTAKDKTYTIGSISPRQEVAPRSKAQLGAQLYLGPETTDDLKLISKGLELTVDYGILWPISQFIFLVLKSIYQFVGNWGWAIILVTALLRLSFYRLSASAYRSMANLRNVQPKIQAMKERYGDDRQKMSIAMMELYKKEKINPLGGCLPILIQIPVFIALYYVLLESVELRHSPFIFWITDLASKDPYYVLPVLMGLTMLVQQKLNPPPPDPVQAKVMMLLPVIFTVLFLQFPSGLVLYWFVNNLLSILQQWYITKSMVKENVVVRSQAANG